MRNRAIFAAENLYFKRSIQTRRFFCSAGARKKNGKAAGQLHNYLMRSKKVCWDIMRGWFYVNVASRFGLNTYKVLDVKRYGAFEEELCKNVA